VADHLSHEGLTPDEQAYLTRIAGGGPAPLARRARIILGWAQGFGPDEIAGRVGLSERTVRKWLRAFFEQRLGIFPGEALVEAQLPRVAQVREKPKRARLYPHDTMREAGRKTLCFHFQRMLYHEPGTRLGEDIEALHDMRVATRRMRAAMGVFGPYLEKKARRWLLRGQRATGRALGRVRDLDVFSANVRGYRDSLGGDNGGLDSFLAHLERKREKARGKMLAYLDDEAYKTFTGKMVTFCETPDEINIDATPHMPGPPSVKNVVPHLIHTRYDEVRAYESLLDGAPIATLHALRIEAKRLRYTLEFFSDVLGPEADGLIKMVVRVQDHLGALQDASVAQSIVERYMARVRKRAKKEQKQSGLPFAEPRLEGVAAYLEARRCEMEHLRKTFPELWEELISLETRRRLALAVSVL
jgi:CHAD domain-containing protein/DNA-binding CsgD family transcriptional regulator